MPDSETIAIEQLCGFRDDVYALQNFKLIVFKMADLRPLLTLIWVISGKPCQIARTSLINKMCGFGEGYFLKNINTIKFKMADLQPLLTLIWLISGKPCQIDSFTIEENVLFQGELFHGQFQFDLIQNG